MNLSVDSSSKASSDWVSAYKNKNIKLQLDTYFAAEIWQCMKTRLTICVQMHQKWGKEVQPKMARGMSFRNLQFLVLLCWENTYGD